MKIVIINGFPRSGKSTFVGICKNLSLQTNIFVREVSTVDFVKDIATKCGWNGEKDAKNRKFLSDLKDLLTEWNDIPIKDIKNSLKKFETFLKVYGNEKINNNSIFFIHCREPKEIERLKQELNAVTLLIVRDCELNKEQSNHSDSEVLNYKYDYVIGNNGTLQRLEGKALNFIREINK